MKTKTIGICIALFVPALYALEFNVQKDIRYSDADTRCVLDVKTPVGAKGFATIVNFHGGGLAGGDKHFAPWPAEAKDADPVAFVAVRYRLMKKNGSVAPKDCLDDAAAAVAWTIKNIAGYGGDPKKVFVTGISAGGYLTAMIGLDGRWLAPHGLKPADLAGIVPLTGQMTKHFNVRKIGFNDNDPQYQPKIDEWAPLAYAMGANLPPACFCTGGRDVEWKCRVEENELLAASLRNCGYPRTEFHETEGDHGGGVRESAYFLRDFAMKTVDAGGVGRFAPGERVVFYGDSITHGGKYIYYLQLFENLRNPGSGVRMINGGRSGGTAGDGLARFNRDLLPKRPDRVFVMFGMNDVGRDNWKSAAPDEKTAAARQRSIDSFAANTAKLVDRLAEKKIKTVLVTPSPFDQYGEFARENIPFCNDPGLAGCAKKVREIAAQHNLGVVDLHATMTKIFADHASDYHFCGDRVHPGNEGHLLMAAHVLDAMHVSPIVAAVKIDAAQKKVGSVGRETINATATELRVDGKGLAFTYAPKALPFPAIPEYLKMDGAFYPLTEKLNRETITVDGLAAGTYAISFDGEKVAEATAEQLAAGLNVAMLNTPNQRRANEIVAPMRRIQSLMNGYRNVVLVKYMIADAGVDASDRAAADRYLDGWLEKQKTSKWYNGLKAWVDGYRNGRDTEEAVLAEVEDLHERMAAVRPVISRVNIKKLNDK